MDGERGEREQINKTNQKVEKPGWGSSVGGINEGLRADGAGKAHGLIVLHFETELSKEENKVYTEFILFPLPSALSNQRLNHFVSGPLNSVKPAYILVEQIYTTFSSCKSLTIMPIKRLPTSLPLFDVRQFTLDCYEFGHFR